MATNIIDFLPKDSAARQKYESDVNKFERTFKLPTGTVKEVEKKRRARRRSSGGSSSSNNSASFVGPPEPVAPEPPAPEPAPIQLPQDKPDGSIKSQLEAPVMSAYTRDDRQSFLRNKGGYYKQSLFESAKQLTGQFKTIGPAIQYGNKGGGFLEPFKYSEGFFKDETFSIVPAFGTVTPQTQSGFITTTLGQKQAEIEQDRNFKEYGLRYNADKELSAQDKKLQEDINSGSITYDDAIKKQEEFYNKANEKLKDDTNKLYNNSKDVLGVGGRTGKVRQKVEIIGDIAAAGAGTINPAFGLGYFGSKGIYKGNTARTKGEQISAGLDVAFAGGYLGGVVARAGRAVVASELRSAAEQPIKYGNVQLGDKAGFDILRGTQKYGNIKRDIEIYGTFVKDGKGGFFTPRGGGTVTTSGSLNFRTIPFQSPTSTKFVTGFEKFTTGFKGTSIQIGENMAFAGGKGVLIPQYSAGGVFDVSKGLVNPIYKYTNVGGKGEIGFYGGISKRTGKNTYDTIGGELIFNNDKTKLAGIKWDSAGKTLVTDLPPGFSVGGFEQTGDDVAKYLYGSGGTKTPFSVTFGEGGQQTKSAQNAFFKFGSTDLLGRGTAQTAKNTAKSITKTSSLGGPNLITTTTDTETPSIYGFQPLSPRTLNPFKTDLGNTLVPGTRSGTRSGSGIRSGSRSGSASRNNLIQPEIIQPELVTPQIISPIKPNKPPLPTRLNARGYLKPFMYLPGASLGIPKFKVGKSGRSQRSRQVQGYNPSFTASALKIRGAPKVSKQFGVNPLAIRGLTTKKKKKKKKGFKFF